MPVLSASPLAKNRATAAHDMLLGDGPSPLLTKTGNPFLGGESCAESSGKGHAGSRASLAAELSLPLTDAPFLSKGRADSRFGEVGANCSFRRLGEKPKRRPRDSLACGLAGCPSSAGGAVLNKGPTHVSSGDAMPFSRVIEAHSRNYVKDSQGLAFLEGIESRAIVP